MPQHLLGCTPQPQAAPVENVILIFYLLTSTLSGSLMRQSGWPLLTCASFHITGTIGLPENEKTMEVFHSGSKVA